jgi:hypothetical protein
MCLALQKILSTDISAFLRTLCAEGERQIDLSTVPPAHANSVPRERGVRGAARGLERELKGIVATHKKAQKLKVVSFQSLRTSDL